MLAFLAPAVALVKSEIVRDEKITAEKKLPTFKPRWWYKANGLDARPVAWSLINHPEEWVEDSPGISILHKPSKHRFWIGSGRGFYRLYSANCSCNKSEGKFQRFQQGLFHRAYQRWRAPQQAATREQFTGHFIH